MRHPWSQGGQPKIIAGLATSVVAVPQVDAQSPVHPYMQLATQLREQIERGQISSQLPSITELTAHTGLAVGTVWRAIDILVKEGLVQTVPGRGTFVTR
jgi:GntR family transcriptional regulator